MMRFVLFARSTRVTVLFCSYSAHIGRSVPVESRRFPQCIDGADFCGHCGARHDLLAVRNEAVVS